MEARFTVRGRPRAGCLHARPPESAGCLAATLVAVLCLLVSWSLPARAQLLDEPQAPGSEKYANSRWVLQRPDQDPTDACVGGFFSFQFSATGYFVYNNRHRGSWRVDTQGNLRLKTSKGQQLLLLATGATLRAAGNAGFLSKKNVFERCSQ
jgi:hypothetical protein